MYAITYMYIASLFCADCGHYFVIIMVFKILHGLINIDSSIFEFSLSDNLRGHSCKLVRPLSNKKCRFHSFVSRAVNPWNSLPQIAIDASNICVFKRVLQNLNFSNFLHVV